MIGFRRPASSLLVSILIGVLALNAGCAPTPAPASPTPTVVPLVEIARNFEKNGDLIPARAALAGLGLDDPIAAVAQLAQQEAAAGNADDARVLAALAAGHPFAHRRLPDVDAGGANCHSQASRLRARQPRAGLQSCDRRRAA
jgi:hypothetical protein